MNNNNRTASFITAQVAVEAIINSYGEGYEANSVAAVIAFARHEGVADLYIEQADKVLQQMIRNSVFD